MAHWQKHRRDLSKPRPLSYRGPWRVKFKCGKVEEFPSTEAREIKDAAMQLHRCNLNNCRPVEFHPKGFTHDVRKNPDKKPGLRIAQPDDADGNE